MAILVALYALLGCACRILLAHALLCVAAVLCARSCYMYIVAAKLWTIEWMHGMSPFVNQGSTVPGDHCRLPYAGTMHQLSCICRNREVADTSWGGICCTGCTACELCLGVMGGGGFLLQGNIVTVVYRRQSLMQLSQRESCTTLWRHCCRSSTLQSYIQLFSGHGTVADCGVQLSTHMFCPGWQRCHLPRRCACQAGSASSRPSALSHQ
jgi:hypothetical protein